MKSLNPNREDRQGCPFDNKHFTPEVIAHILDEGFEWKEKNSSYADYREDRKVQGCYEKYAGSNHGDWPIFVFICEDAL